jgi:hypothetical protein
MKRINNRKFEVTANELTMVGVEIERILESIKEHDYGDYQTEDLELKTVLALKVIEGMDDWQWENNKGVRIFGDTHIKVSIYNPQELQKRMDEAISKLSI